MTDTDTDTMTCEQYVDDTMSDERIYCDAPATVRIKGEQDSFGIEWMHFCAPCAVEVRREIADEARALRVGVCQWCKCEVDDRIAHPHWDEPWNTSLVCGKCRAKELHDLLDD